MSLITSLSGIEVNDSKDAMKELLVFEGNLALVSIISMTLHKRDYLGMVKVQNKQYHRKTMLSGFIFILQSLHNI